MPAHRLSLATDASERTTNIPRASVIIGVLLLGLCFFIAVAGSTWPPVPTTNAPRGTVAITPDDPAAPTPIPVQELGR
jgi:hypothetical protein